MLGQMSKKTRQSNRKNVDSNNVWKKEVVQLLSHTIQKITSSGSSELSTSQSGVKIQTKIWKIKMS